MKKSLLFTLSFSFFLISGGYGMAQTGQTDAAAGSENTGTRTMEERLSPPPSGDFNKNGGDEFDRPPPPPENFNESGSGEFRQPPLTKQTGGNSEEYGRTSDDQLRKFTKDRRDGTNGYLGRHHGRRHHGPSRRHGYGNRQNDI